MHQFRNDYSEGAAPQIMRALADTNAEQTVGYGDDPHCERAAELIREEVGAPDATVRFIPGGTAANILAITALTEEYEGPVLASDAHPTIHETGAIEGHGRRLLATRDKDGVLTPEGAEPVWRAWVGNGSHTTRPGMVYLSDTSELGHVYTASEFDAVCDWADARADAFTLGGTRDGMLFGEALVVRPRSERSRRAIERLPYLVKRAGSLLAKGRLMGVQYEAAFAPKNRDKAGEALYWGLARHANARACELARGLVHAGFEPYIDTTGNQQFFWASPEQAEALSRNLGCELQDAADPSGAGRRVVRFVTSWATPQSAVTEAIAFARTLA